MEAIGLAEPGGRRPPLQGDSLRCGVVIAEGVGLAGHCGEGAAATLSAVVAPPPRCSIFLIWGGGILSFLPLNSL